MFSASDSGYEDSKIVAFFMFQGKMHEWSVGSDCGHQWNYVCEISQDEALEEMLELSEREDDFVNEQFLLNSEDFQDVWAKYLGLGG